MYINRGLVYQNAFIYWFNHYRESGYNGPTYTVVVIHQSAQPGHGDAHLRFVPMGSLLMWIGRIWAAQYGVTP